MIPLLLLLATAEMAVRAYYYQKHASYPAGLVQIYEKLLALKGPATAGARHVGQPYFQADPVIGYKYQPGVHGEAYVQGNRRLDYRVTIGTDGFRITSANPEAYAGKPGIWIFGCSFTWGLGENDAETFPWLLQRDLPNWRVRNLAIQGYGNLPALLLLNDAAANGKPMPAIAVFVYDTFHMERNVGRPAYLLSMSRDEYGDDKGIRFVRAKIDPEGNFQIEHVELREQLWRSQADPGSAYEILVTQVIFYRISEFCRQHGIIPVFAIQTLEKSDPLPAYAAGLGFRVVDFSINLEEAGGFKYRNFPFDGHPNKLAHAEYAKRLLPTIQALLSTTPARE